MRFRIPHCAVSIAAIFTIVLCTCTAPTVSASQVANDIYTAAGTGTAGYTGDGSPATGATLSTPIGIAIDSSGNLYVADMQNSVVREIAATTHTQFGISMTAGDIYTVAGTGTAGTTGAGGPATSAELNQPWGVYVDSSGNLFIADSAGNIVQEVAATSETEFGITMTANDIYTIAGTGAAAYSGIGGPATSAAIAAPRSLAMDSTGNLYIAGSSYGVIEELAAANETEWGQTMTANDLYTVAGTGTSGNTGNAGPATSAELNGPCDVTLDSAGDIIIADQGNNIVREVAATAHSQFGIAMTANDIYTIAGTGTASYSGDGGAATAATLNQVAGAVVLPNGNLVVVDYLNQRIRMVAAVSGTYYQVPMTAGDIYTIAGTGTASYSGDGGAALSATFDNPGRAVVDSAGDLYITDELNNAVREIAGYSNTGSITVTDPVQAGTLAFITPPAGFTFTAITLNGTNQTMTGTESIDVGDNTGSGSGWNVTLSNTTFSNGGSGTLANADFTIPAMPSVACDAGVTCSPASLTNLYSAYALPGTTAAPLLEAAAASGMANQTVTIPWQVSVPASALSGSYSSTWILTLQAGP